MGSTLWTSMGRVYTVVCLVLLLAAQNVRAGSMGSGPLLKGEGIMLSNFAYTYFAYSQIEHTFIALQNHMSRA